MVLDRLSQGLTRFIDLWSPWTGPEVLSPPRLSGLVRTIDLFAPDTTDLAGPDTGLARMVDLFAPGTTGSLGSSLVALRHTALPGSPGATASARHTARTTPAGPAYPGDGTVPTGSIPKGTGGVFAWADQINEAARVHGVPAIVIAAIMAGESGGDPSARSGAGASGLMQVMPQYHAHRAAKYGGDLSDPRVNILVGTEYLKESFDKAKRLYPGISDHRAWEIAAAQYLGDWDWERGDYAGRADMYGTDGRKYVETFNRNLRQLAPQLVGAGGGTAAPGALGQAIQVAHQYLGMPYVFGGASPTTSFDCSGLVQWSFRQAGIALPRTAQQQWDATQRVSDPRPGDLVFFHSTYRTNDYITHVGIYLGNGQMLHAGSRGVEITDLSQLYWQQHFAGYGRIR